MSEFVYMEGWDLQAVVRGSTDETSANLMNNPQSLYAPLSFDEQDHDVLLSFPENFETTTIFDDLEDLYKPFYPVLHPLSPQAILASPISVPKDMKEKEHPKQEPSPETDIAPVVQSKRRKNRHKTVVQQVTAEGLLSDKWAWRKYGQKPIKGSPYPRSYYRCSSSKGCLARKQVERNPENPKFYIITYTAEHSHTHPTRRSSLAGSTRNKSSSTPNKVPAIDGGNPHIITGTDLSPSTTTDPPLMASIEDHNNFAQEEKIKRLEEQMLLEDDQESNTEVMMPDIIFRDELFPSLEDMERLFLDQS